MRGWQARWPRTTHDLTVSAFTDPLRPGRAEHSFRVPDLLQEPPLLPLWRPRRSFSSAVGAPEVWDVDGNEYSTLPAACCPAWVTAIRTWPGRAGSAQPGLHLLPAPPETEVATDRAHPLRRDGPQPRTAPTPPPPAFASPAPSPVDGVVCGYRLAGLGIGSTTRHLGVPECVRELTASTTTIWPPSRPS